MVGTAVAYGGKAVEVATTVKLARALWIVPLTLGLSQWQGRRDGGEKRSIASHPWFVLGFLVAAALVTFVPILQPVGHRVSSVAMQALVVTLFFIGASLTPGAIRTVGLRPLGLGVLLWVVMGGLSLAAIVTRLISV